jgi:hypothetical protein
MRKIPFTQIILQSRIFSPKTVTVSVSGGEAG